MVKKRQGRDGYTVYFRPFGAKLIGLQVDVETKSEAKFVEQVILRACKTGRYGDLDPVSHEACIRLFENQNWELPSELRSLQEQPKEELTIWRACEVFFKYPGICDSKTRERYEASLAHVVRKLGRDRPIKSLWIPDLKAYQVERLNEGAATATVNKEMGAFSRLFGVLVELQYVETNPCRLVKRLSEKSGEREVYLSLGDTQRIISFCSSWYAPLVWTGFFCGMRRGEIIGLTWKQVNLGKRMILLSPGDTKESSWKRIPLRTELIPIFESCMKVRSLETDRVFLIDGRVPSVESLKNPWRRACRAIELTNPRPRFHDLRHTWKTNARRSGMDPEIREAILGHANRERSVRDRYGRISDQELLQAIDAMGFDHGETEILVASRSR